MGAIKQRLFLTAVLFYMNAVPLYAGETLFMDEPERNSAEAEKIRITSEMAQSIQKAEWVKRCRFGGIRPELLLSEQFVVNLFPDVMLDARFLRSEQSEQPSKTIWIGRTDGFPYNNVIIGYNTKTNYISGVIHTPGVKYRFWTLPDGTCVIAETIATEKSMFTNPKGCIYDK